MYFRYPIHQYGSYFASWTEKYKDSKKLDEGKDVPKNDPLKYYQLQIFYLENKTFM